VKNYPWEVHDLQTMENNTSAAVERGTTDWLTTSSPPESVLWIENIGFYVHFCAVGVIIPVGLVCNAFSIGVFVAATKFRRTSTGQLLIALSAVDWLVLIGDGLRWLAKDKNRVYITGLSFYNTSDFACKFVNIWRYRSDTLTLSFNVLYVTCVLPRDASMCIARYCYRKSSVRSSVRLSVSIWDVEVLWLYTLDYFESNYTDN